MAKGKIMTTEQQIKAVCQKFDIKGEFRSFERVDSGQINTTYRVYFFRNREIKDYILQQVNTNVFKDPVAMMENISSVTEYIRAKIKQKQATAKRNELFCRFTIQRIDFSSKRRKNF